jgi:hypothetical protein
MPVVWRSAGSAPGPLFPLRAVPAASVSSRLAPAPVAFSLASPALDGGGVSREMADPLPGVMPFDEGLMHRSGRWLWATSAKAREKVDSLGTSAHVPNHRSGAASHPTRADPAAPV